MITIVPRVARIAGVVILAALAALPAAAQTSASPVLGNPQGDVTILEFSDYQCIDCKRSQPVMERLLQEDGGLRIELKEFAFLGPVSVTAARAALAAQKQGRYAAFHTRLMRFKGRLSDDLVFSTARQVGLDVDRLKRDMADPAVTAELEAVRALARSLGVEGAPAYVVNGRMVPHSENYDAVGYDVLKSQIDQARARK
ncbi:DsbA family protein [Inquilinus limosus]|uniref:DsbA family protein n=1 Tax=Inquilinus limosus TaxID=171674 RepID=UPI003F14079C